MSGRRFEPFWDPDTPQRSVNLISSPAGTFHALTPQQMLQHDVFGVSSPRMLLAWAHVRARKGGRRGKGEEEKEREKEREKSVFMARCVFFFILFWFCVFVLVYVYTFSVRSF